MVFIFSSCGKKINHGEIDFNEFSSDINSSSDLNDTSDIIVIEDMNISSSDSRDTSNSIANVNKSVLLKNKLSECGVTYIPWKDRLEKDLILQPKVLKICDKLQKSTNGYILHSTKVRRQDGFIRGSHVYIPYSWSTQQITEYLKKNPKKTVKKSRKKSGFKTVGKKDELQNGNSVVKIENSRVVEVGSPYFIAE
jgi:hypothetical protein